MSPARSRGPGRSCISSFAASRCRRRWRPCLSAHVSTRGGDSMMAVIFEVWPAKGRKEDYLRLAASLRSEVETIDGFISVERFESLYEEGKLLSLQFWRDDGAI